MVVSMLTYDFLSVDRNVRIKKKPLDYSRAAAFLSRKNTCGGSPEEKLLYNESMNINVL